MNTAKMNKALLAALTAGLCSAPVLASAQTGEEVPEDDDMVKESIGMETDNDPIPEPPRPAVIERDQKILEQAGTGSTIAYAEAGVLELGGSASFSTSNALTTTTVSPTIGWFIADNIQLSGIIDLNYANVDGADGALSTAALLEPSYHLPFTDRVFGFAGLGAGISYFEDAGAGFAVRPRVGANIIVGRSGIFTPAVNVGYSTVEAASAQGRTLLTVEPSVGLSAGYTVMW